MSATNPTVPISGVKQILNTASNLVTSVAATHPNIIHPDDHEHVQELIQAAKSLNPDMITNLTNASALVKQIAPKVDLNNVAANLPPVVQEKMNAVRNILKTAASLASLVNKSAAK